MGYVSLAFIVLTAIALVFGTLFGMKRGRNRAILRLILIVICAVTAILLRGVIVDTLMGIKIEGKTLEETLLAAFNEGDVSLPASMQNLIFAMIEIVVGLVSYFVLFFALRLVSWIIIYPICKIFVKKGPRYTVERKRPTRKGETTKVKRQKRKWWGALVGLIQGVLVAFFVLSPATCLLMQVDKISKIQINGEQLFELPEEVGITEYTDSTLGKVYGTVGGWYFDIITSTTTEDGNKVSINDTIDIVVTVTDIADTVTGLEDSINKMSGLNFDGDTTEADIHEAVVAMTELGDGLIEIGDKIDDLSDDAKQLIDSLLESIKDMIPDEEGAEEVKDAFDNLTLEDLDLAGVGNAIKGIAVILDKTEGTRQDEPIAQTEITQIIGGLASNEFILNLIPADEPLLDVNDVGNQEEADLANMFTTAINELPASESKTKLQFLFGLN